MNPQDLTPDEAAASLAFATNLSEASMPQGEGGEDTQAEEESVDKTAPNLDAKISSIVDEKLATFKEELLAALEENGQEKDTTADTGA